MKKRLRKALSVGLALLLSVSMLPLHVLAEGLDDARNNDVTEIMENDISAEVVLPESETTVSEDIIDSLEDINDAGTEDADSEDTGKEDGESEDAETEDTEAADAEEDAEAEDTESEDVLTEEETGDAVTDEQASDGIVEEDIEEPLEIIERAPRLELLSQDEDALILDAVESFSCPDITWVEGDYNNHRDRYYDEESGQDIFVEWDAYDVHPRYGVEVKLKDDDEPITGNFWDVRDELERRLNVQIDEYVEGDDQRPDRMWEAGTTHNVTLHMGPLSDEIAVSIVESPIADVKINDIKRFEGDCDMFDRYWDPEKEQDVFVDFLAYRTYPEYMEVTLNPSYVQDGMPTVIKGNPDEVRDSIAKAIEADRDSFTFYEFTDDDATQTPDHVWGVGTHPVHFNAFGHIYDFNVIVEANPIQEVTVDSFKLFDNEKEGRDGYWDEEKHEWVDQYHEVYRTWPNHIKVVTTEGTFESNDNPNDVREALAEKFGLDSGFMDFGVKNDNQNPKNVWEIGPHTMIFSVCGVPAEYTIEIVENPIKSITVDPITVLEGDKEKREGYWDEEKQEWIDDVEWFCYHTWPYHISVDTTKGVFESDDPEEIRHKLAEEFELDAEHMDFGDQQDQTPDHIWGVGVHPVTFRICGVEGAYTVEVVENPIESVEVESFKVLEGDLEMRDRYWDEERHEDVFEPWYAYNTWPNHIKIATSFGEFEGDDVNYVRDQLDKAFKENTGLDTDKFYFGVDDGQSPDSCLNVGVNPLVFSVYGVTADYSVEVIENPIVSVEAEDKFIVAGDTIWNNYYRNPETGEESFDEWEAYDTWPDYIKVELKDHSTIEGNIGDVYEELSECLGSDVVIRFNTIDEQKPEKLWETGVYSCSFGFAGVYGEFEVTIMDSPIISIACPETLYLIEGDTYTEEGYWDESGHFIEEEWQRYGYWPGYMEMVIPDEYLKADETNPIGGSTEDLAARIAEILDVSPDTIHLDFDGDSQRPDNQWTAGHEETVGVRMAGKSADLKIKVVQFPVKDVQVEDFSVYPDELTTLEEYFDPEKGIVFEEFEGYPYRPSSITVTYLDGTTETGHPLDIQDKVSEMMAEEGYVPFDMHAECDQTPSNKWGTGEHTCGFYFGNKLYEYHVTVLSDMAGYTGLAKNDKKYNYYKDGEQDSTFTGFIAGPVVDEYNYREPEKSTYVPETDGFWYVKDGVVDSEVNFPPFVKGIIEGKEGTYKLKDWRFESDFTGIFSSEEKMYFFKEGTMLTGWIDFEGSKYYADEEGVVATGWTKIDEAWYYMDEDGEMITGWFKVGTKWYYFLENGKMATGWTKVENKWYFMSDGGAMQTGWVKSGNKWYFMDDSGAMRTGWVKSGNKWYFMDESGAMRTGWLKSGKTWYYMGDGGAMSIGWVKAGSKWYYMESSGAMKTGWLQYGGKWYYLNPDGSMATSQWVGKYYIQADGTMR